MPVEKRLPLLHKGLELLIPHITELAESAKILRGEGRDQAAAVLEAFANEEAAKVLIILDLIRQGWKDQKVTKTLTTAFTSHVSRGLYANVAAISPASFGEVRRYIDGLRKSRYLDGPNDVDWTFRNSLETEREEALYVDLVKYDDGLQWVSPQQYGGLRLAPRTQIVDLVLAMSRIGLLTVEGLTLLHGRWAKARLNDDLTWPEHRRITVEVLNELIDQELYLPSVQPDDAQQIAERWSFPMGTLDLTLDQVTDEELERQRAAAEARLLRENAGFSERADW